MKKKKIKFIALTIFIVFVFINTYVFISTSLGNKNSGLAQNLKKLVPIEIKKFLKSNIFIVKNLKNEINFQKNIVEIKEKQISEILDEVLNEKGVDISFNKNFEKKFKINDIQNFDLKKYKTNLLVHGKWHRAKGTSYLSIGDDMLLLASGSGYFAYTKLDFFEKDTINFKIINSNIKDIVTQEEFYKSSLYGIKGLLYNNNQIYISLTYEKRENCFNTSVFYANLNYTKLQFKEFFSPDECVKKRKVDFQPAQSGGKMIINDGKMILTIGDWRYRDLAQNKESVFGKIVEINLENKDYKILSLGHRNPQGLSLNSKNNLLVNTEHGPNGGDEINFNKNFKKNLKNFGWPISSYGEHYGFEKRNPNHKMYKKFPLYKSHSKYNFIEPTKYYVPSIAISQIAEIDSKISSDELFYVVGALGDTPEIGQMSLHFLKFNKKDFKLKSENIVNINERVRDLIYFEKEKVLILFLETSASIGLLRIN